MWRKLVKQGLHKSEDYDDPNVLYVIEDEQENQDEIIEKCNEELPTHQQAVRGRGKYSNMIVKREKQMSMEDTARHAVRKTAKTIKNPEVYEKLQATDDFNNELERLVMQSINNVGNEELYDESDDEYDEYDEYDECDEYDEYE